MGWTDGKTRNEYYFLVGKLFRLVIWKIDEEMRGKTGTRSPFHKYQEEKMPLF
jgi:hypothetical protein